jgi:LemA protein
VGAVVAVVIVVVILVLLVLWVMLSYNGLVRLRNQVQSAWRQIDVELTRRHDLIPNLVETVKGYASHERETLDAVVRARTAATAPGASVAQQAQQEGELSQALGRLLAITEAYPDLKANQNFMALQNELGQTEDRIAAGRRFYNATVQELNTKIESIPSNILAGMFHFERADYFEAENSEVRAVPQVSFGGSSGPSVSFGGPTSPPSGPASALPPREPGAPPTEYGSPE